MIERQPKQEAKMKQTSAARMLMVIGLLTAALFAGTLPRPALAAASFSESSIILNGVAHDVNADTGNPDFANAHLGNFNAATNPLILSGGQVKTASNDGSYVLSTRLNYRIYPTGSPNGSFMPLELPLVQNLGSGNERWALTGMSIDLLVGLTPGNYTLEIYYDATTNGTNTANPIYDNAGGANYKATFTLAPIYVNINQPDDSGDGLSWATAKRNLQTALAMANPAGTHIWVAAGMYYPDEGWLQNDNARESTFRLKNNVAVYGGFAGTETQLSQRNPTTHVTLLSGDVDGNFEATGNAYHVVTSNGNTNTALLDGFTISSGNANGSEPNERGGGVYVIGNSQAQFANLTINSNHANFYGGGVYNEQSSPSFINTLISYNHTNTSDPSQRERGGGVYNYEGNPSFTNVTMSENYSLYGGGVSNHNSSPTFTNVTISGNFVSIGGGGIHNYGSYPSFTNTLISGNRAFYGGAMRNEYDNRITFTNATISGNYAFYSVGGIQNPGGEITFTNTLVWGNVRDDGNNSDPQVESSSPVTYTNSLVQGATLPGAGNLPGTTDPRFISPVAATADTTPTAGGDYRLQLTSPVLDMGSNAANTTPTDRDGRQRIIGDTIDLGAYELPIVINVEPNQTFTFENGGTVTIQTTGEIGNLAALFVEPTTATPPNAAPGIQTGRYWTIRGLQADHTTAATGFTVTLTITVPFTPTAADKLCRYTGTDTIWDCAADSFDPVNKTITRNNITAFSLWAIGNNEPTAITLLDFSATREANGVRLDWATGSERNTAGFRIERGSTNNAASAVPLEVAGFIPSAGDVSGAAYTYLDQNPTAAEAYVYWLIEVERDGRETRYGPVRIDAGVASRVHRVMLPFVGR
jgi:hypothetical protein